MTRLNKYASAMMVKYKANACTDITGFGLAGHSMQMASASKKVFEFEVSDLPVLNGALEAVRNNMLTRGDKSNRIYTKNSVFYKGEINKVFDHLLYDPQTSGGLLISVSESDADKILKELHSEGDLPSKIVGSVLKPDHDYKAGSIIFKFNK
jgi:selenide,water dikinase